MYKFEQLTVSWGSVGLSEDCCVMLPLVLVLDDSPAIRETVAILLGADYEVEAASVEEYRTQEHRRTPDLVIAGESTAARHVLRGLPATARVLWLAPAGFDRRPIAGEGRLPRRFSPHELRAEVEKLLAQPAGGRTDDRVRRLLQPPYVPAKSAGPLSDATATDLPLLLQGEAGVGKQTLARAVHELRGGGTFLMTTGAGFLAQEIPAAVSHRGTLYIESVHQLNEDAQQRLLAMLGPGGTVNLASGAVRLICSSTADLAPIVDDGRFAAELYYRIGILTVSLPPLRDRPHDIPALAELLAENVRSWLGCPPASFTPAARERLSRYLWFGNIAELEAVLVRTLSFCPTQVVDADDLLFESESLRPARAASPPARTDPEPSGRVRPENLDLVINELAHEFKNPLVTIKTFAQHLKKVLADSTDAQQVAQLTGDAVDQIDHTLENLLRFTRLQAPVLQNRLLDSLITPVAEELSHTLAERGARLKYEPPPPVAVSVDPEQAAYALGNLLRALCRDLGPRQGQLVVRFRPPSGIEVELPRGSPPLGSQLTTLLDGPDTAPPRLPLGVAIATAVLERNQAQVVLPSGRNHNAVTVHFAVAPNQEEATDNNGQAPRTHR
jgi:hypothetical protein